MQPLIKQFLATSFFILFSCTIAQSQEEDLTKDIAFFEEQTEVYQKWLNHSALGQYLKIEDINVEKNNLSLYLSFPFSDVDSVITAWEFLKKDFEASSSLILEEQLFYKAATLMEVPQSMINIQLYDSYDLQQEPLFFRAIYFEEAIVKIEESKPKDKRRSINLKPRGINHNKKASVEEFKQHFTQEKVFDCVYDYMREKYQSSPCDKKNPNVRLLQSQRILRIEVSNLCREVLTNNANSVLCTLLENFDKDCSSINRELLIFTITYEETRQGFRLVMSIDGKYGSGNYAKASRGDYMSMEIDFDEYLEEYSNELTYDLRRMLMDCD